MINKKSNYLYLISTFKLPFGLLFVTTAQNQKILFVAPSATSPLTSINSPFCNIEL